MHDTDGFDINGSSTKTYHQPAISLTPGTVIGGKYELLEQIGRGAMGVVWKASDKVGRRLVALKFVPKEVSRFETEMQRVLATFSKVHALHHQAICPIYSLEDGGQLGYYLVMKYLEGETLDAYVLRKASQSETLPLNQVVALLSRIAAALDYAHENDVIHRDIKPSNIFLVKSKGKLHVQVIDFGLADEIRTSMTRVSQPGQSTQTEISGTFAYMSPEQMRGRSQSAATDQYALAVMAYELLAGYLPFQGASLAILMRAVIEEPPEPIPTISDSANAVLKKALAKDAADRFRTCRDFITSLGSAWTTVATAAPEDEDEYEDEAEGKEEAASFTFPSFTIPDVPRWVWAVAGCVLLAVLGTIIWGIGSRNKTVPPDVVNVVVENEPAALPQRAVVTQPQRAGDRMTLTIKDVEYAFRWCPPGKFMRGSPQEEANRKNDERQHEVTLTRGFWMLETEVTQKMWESVMGSNPSHFKGAKLPVEMVSWNDCQEYITKLNALLTSTPGLLAGTPGTGFKFSLPTEAQWEYACRADTTTAYHFGDSLSTEQANFGHDWNTGKTKEVGSYPANAWGLKDMHGNLWEWCQDWYGNYPSGAVTDATGAERGSNRVLRGGTWSSRAQGCRSAYRLSVGPADRNSDIGFRLVLISESTATSSYTPPPLPPNYRPPADITDLLDAADKGTVNDVRYFIDGGGKIEQSDDIGRTLLNRAARNNPDVEVVKYLISEGADVKTKSDHGWTPLHNAVEHNSNMEVIKHLVSCGANINAKRDNGNTPLHNAAQNSPNAEVMRYLVSVPGIDVNAKDTEGRTPLDLANTDEKQAILRAAGGKNGSEL